MYVGWSPIKQYDLSKEEDESFCILGYAEDGSGACKVTEDCNPCIRGRSFSGPDPQAPWFNLGENTGLVHSWTDTSILNGHRYFYAVTAYDHGDFEKEILPAETSKFVTIDKSGIVQTASNVISVIPDAPAAESSASTSGTPAAKVVDKVRA